MCNDYTEEIHPSPWDAQFDCPVCCMAAGELPKHLRRRQLDLCRTSHQRNESYFWGFSVTGRQRRTFCSGGSGSEHGSLCLGGSADDTINGQNCYVSRNC